MRRSALFLVALVILATIYSLLPKEAYSGDLGTLVRLDVLKISSSTGGTICATPESSGTESSIQIIFPTGMNVNSNSSNWTVTTSDLPSGATAMPGVTTATNVSGQIVTFPISDLSTGTQYCFNFASSNTLTTPSSTGNYEGTLRTRNSSNTVIDTRNFGIPIVSSSSITVTATAPAQPTDFSASLSVSPGDDRIRENTDLTYTLTYGSNLSYAHGITVEAEWEPGTISGGSPGTEEVLSYVVGSAGDAYNNTPAVIDLVNDKITWTISSFPANSTRSVTFKLRTYDDYTGSKTVETTVNGRVLGPGTQTADYPLVTTYQYSSYITPTPAPTCVPSICPTQVPSATPTPTPVPDATTINNIEIGSLSDSGAKINIETNNITTIKLLYGTSISNLNQSITSLNQSKFHALSFEDLDPRTRYYFTVTVTDQYKRKFTSDLYQFDTAVSSDKKPEILLDSLIITSSDVILTDPLRPSGNSVKIVIPQNASYAFKFAVRGYENVKLIKSALRDSKVLGLTSNVSYASTEALSITEISPGQYIGKLTTGYKSGTHYLVFQISDYLGNINEYVITTINIVSPLRAINSATKEGIENAKATLYIYNNRLRTYELISSALTPINNPLRSEPDGKFNVVLPEGKYKAEVELLGFASKTVEFEVSPTSSTNYPIIELESLPPNFATYFAYTLSTFLDVFTILQNFIHTLRSSIRFFDLTAFIGIMMMSLLLVISASRRLSVPIIHLPHFVLYHIFALVKKPDNDFLVHGKVTVEGVDNVISGALVYISLLNGKVLAHTRSNIDGEFFAKIKTEKELRILVSNKGYQSTTVIIKKTTINDQHNIGLTPRKKPQKISFSSIFWYISFLTGSLFETILILTLIIELLFVLEFGFWKGGPFMLITLFNLLLWGFHVRHTKSA